MVSGRGCGESHPIAVCVHNPANRPPALQCANWYGVPGFPESHKCISRSPAGQRRWEHAIDPRPQHHALEVSDDSMVFFAERLASGSQHD